MADTGNGDAWWQCRDCETPRPKNITVGWLLDLKDKTCRCPSCDDAARASEREPPHG